MSIRITSLADPERGPSSYRLASDADGIPVGSAFLRVSPRPDRTTWPALELHVHPAERRNGTGSRLLDTAVAAAREQSRRCVVTQAIAGSPGDRFLAARSFHAPTP